MMTEPGGGVFRRGRSGQASRGPRQGRIPLGGRLLGRVRLAGVGACSFAGAARKRVSDLRRAAQPLDSEPSTSDQRNPTGPVDRLLVPHGRGTSERFDSGMPHMRAIQNARGHIIVLMTHNTDFGDAFEREGENREFFEEFAARGYAVGINVFLYAMTH